MEKEHIDLKNNYDKDQALWTEKQKFLESQRDQLKRDSADSQRKFEMTLEQLQRRETIEKDQFEANQNTLIQTIEAKYKNQLKEMSENSTSQTSEKDTKIKVLEKENRSLKDKLHLEQRERSSNSGNLEKKNIDLVEINKKMMHEMDHVKAERDRRMMDHSKELEHQKDIFKQKYQEIESKCKEADNKRTTLVFEFEKELAKWQLQKDHLIQQRTEQEDNNSKLSRRNETLMRENEKLKNESRGARKFMYGPSGSQAGAIERSSSLYKNSKY